jgi:hypothetical protein
MTLAMPFMNATALAGPSRAISSNSTLIDALTATPSGAGIKIGARGAAATRVRRDDFSDREPISACAMLFILSRLTYLKREENQKSRYPVNKLNDVLDKSAAVCPICDL